MKTIGIIGGVGPEATLDLYRWIIKLTPAKKDQDHVPTLIYSLPQIPDRTRALLYGGKDPLPYLVKAAKVLEKGGADFCIIPCNTAHAFIDQLQKKVRIPIINMIEETAKYVISLGQEEKRVGLLATTGTIKTKIYHDTFSRYGLEIIVPPMSVQERNVMEAIYGSRGIKAGFTRGIPEVLLRLAVEHLTKKGIRTIIMGCTEIPLVFQEGDVRCLLVNPTQILAQSAVTFALGDSQQVYNRLSYRKEQP
ncbi:MAG: amino acid racemase [Candidatus Gottesmanbacteria bacterium]|nr:amino acid racemase [Candidatus Gottesmanbacteria bacterium]